MTLDALVVTEQRFTESFASTAEHLRRWTVHVRSGQMGSGSGVVWRADGLIITNAHVARTETVEVELADGRVLAGTVIATDAQRDLAAIRVPASDLPAASIGDSDRLRVGQLVAAVGNPLGLSGALTVGIIHSIAPAPTGGRQSWVQADVHLAPGNSGGPLADVEGRVIGINSMVAGGLGLAVPAGDVERFLNATAQRPRLGIVSQPVVVPAGTERIPGLLILAVEPKGAGAAAGLGIGDVLTGANDHPFERSTDLAEVLYGVHSGGQVQLDGLHGGQPATWIVTLAEPSSQEAA